MAGGRFWTTLEHAKLVRLLSEGVSYGEIARQLNRSYTSVAQRAFKVSGRERLPRVHQKGELAERVRTLCVPGVSDRVVADILGVSVGTIRVCRKRRNIPPGLPPNGKYPKDPCRMNISNKAKIIWLYASNNGIGMPSYEIAKRVGLTESAVSAALKKLDLQGLGARPNNEEPNPDKIIRYSPLVTAAAYKALQSAAPDMTDSEAARLLGTVKQNIQAARWRYGIKSNNLPMHLKKSNQCRSPATSSSPATSASTPTKRRCSTCSALTTC